MEEEYVQCGEQIAPLKPTSELRLVAVNHRNPLTGYCDYPPVLQQKWVARAKMQGGGDWEEHRWRNVPTLTGEAAIEALALGQSAQQNQEKA